MYATYVGVHTVYTQQRRVRRVDTQAYNARNRGINACCVWSRRAPQGFREIPDSIVRAHNSCAQLIETEEPAADIFKNGGSDVAKDRPRYSLHEMHARPGYTYTPTRICTCN